MFYRSCPDIEPPDEADLDDPAMALAAAAVERGEQDLRMLSRLAEIGMELAEALGAHARARLAAAAGEGGALGPNEDPTAPFNKMAQTVRRTLALRARIAVGVETGHADLIGKRAARREKRDEDHRHAKRIAVEASLYDALSEDYPGVEDQAAERLLGDLDELLDDCDEFADFLDRPVGETVARLCKALDLDPALCVRDGDGWKVRREPYPFEKNLSPSPPSPSWGGTGCGASRVGESDLSAEACKAKVEATTDPAGSP